ncbi:MAG TPA: lipopolysaccharide biosynthesis protein [Planctomycetota bacterium]|nr:lipopolysaccharide biosynthesis protein [Planctomycetota bacterium]
MARRAYSKRLGWITWSSLGLGAQGTGQFLLLAILARYLTATEFGVVSATMIVIGLGRTLQTCIGPALVQRDELRPEHVRSAFALCVLIAAAMVAVMWLAAPLAAQFFRVDEISDVMRAMSLLFVCQTPGLVPEALLQREMRLRALAIAEVVGVAAGYVPIGIGCAWCGLGVWSLVAAHIGQALLKSTVLLIARPHEWALLPTRRETGELLYFSGGFAAAALANYAASQGDNFVVGRWMSAAHLGIYGRAYQLMAMPAMFLGEVVDRVLFPLMSRFQSDKERLRRAYGRSVSLIASVMTPAAVAGIVLAPEIVRVVLGPGWGEVVPPFRILISGLVFRTGYKISDVLARATGTVYARAWRQMIFAVLILAGAFAGTAAGVTGVAIGIVTAIGINYLTMAGLSLRTTGSNWSEFAALHLRGLVSGTITGAVVLLLAQAIRGSVTDPLLVLLTVAVLMLVLLGAALAIAPRRVLGAEGTWLLAMLLGEARE